MRASCLLILVLFIFSCSGTPFKNVNDYLTLNSIPTPAKEEYLSTLKVLDENLANLVSKKLTRREFMITSKRKIQEFKLRFMKLRVKRVHFKNLVHNLREKLNLGNLMRITDKLNINSPQQHVQNKVLQGQNIKEEKKDQDFLRDQVLKELQSQSSKEIPIVPLYPHFGKYLIFTIVFSIIFLCIFNRNPIICGLYFGCCCITTSCCCGMKNSFIIGLIVAIMGLISLC